MKKVLVVDDEKPISDIIKFNLTKEGYDVFTAFDGEEALTQFAKVGPDIILLDLMLPRWTVWKSAGKSARRAMSRSSC